MRGDGLMFFLGVIAMVILFAAGNIAYEVGYANGRQSMPVACEPKCEFVYRGTKLINVTCPDSSGRMP